MSPLDKLIMKTLIKKNCTDFIRHQIKFYLEFSRWALLTWGPNFLFKDLQLTAVMLRFVSTSTTLFLSHQYLISPSHSTAHGTFWVGLDSASEEEEGSPFLDLFGFVFWGGGREGGQFLEQVSLHWTSPLNISVLRWLHANRSWTSRFCFIWLVGGKKSLGGGEGSLVVNL